MFVKLNPLLIYFLRARNWIWSSQRRLVTSCLLNTCQRALLCFRDLRARLIFVSHLFAFEMPLISQINWPFRSTGYVVHGSNGESSLMDFQERLEMIRITKNLISDGKKLIVGIGKDCKLIFANGHRTVYNVARTPYNVARTVHQSWAARDYVLGSSGPQTSRIL